MTYARPCFFDIIKYMVKDIVQIKRNKIYAIYWQDAAFSYRKKLPKEKPPYQITFGVIISKNKEFINIGMNCHYDAGKKKIIEIKDGFLIPVKTIIQIKEIGSING